MIPAADPLKTCRICGKTEPEVRFYAGHTRCTTCYAKHVKVRAAAKRYSPETPTHRVVPDGYLTVEQAAAIINMNATTVKDMCRLGKLEAIKDPRGWWLVKRESILLRAARNSSESESLAAAANTMSSAQAAEALDMLQNDILKLLRTGGLAGQRDKRNRWWVSAEAVAELKRQRDAERPTDKGIACDLSTLTLAELNARYNALQAEKLRIYRTLGDPWVDREPLRQRLAELEQEIVPIMGFRNAMRARTSIERQGAPACTIRPTY